MPSIKLILVVLLCTATCLPGSIIKEIPAYLPAIGEAVAVDRGSQVEEPRVEMTGGVTSGS